MNAETVHEAAKVAFALVDMTDDTQGLPQHKQTRVIRHRPSWVTLLI